MLLLKPVKGCLFVKWLHSGLYRDASLLELYSNENYLRTEDIRELMCKKYGMGGFVLAEVKKSIGYTIYEKTESNLEIIALTIHQDYRKRGNAKILLQKLATRQNIKTMSMYVRESNLDAHLFLKNQGFLATGVTKKYFADQFSEGMRYEDAYHFKKELF